MLVVENGAIRVLKTDAEKAIFTVLSELQLFLHENPYRYELGVDYFGVFEGRVALKLKVESLLSKFENMFKSLTLTKYNWSTEKEICELAIAFEFEDKSVLKELKVGV